jgi:membrane-associated phospholipid phosphatase
MKRLTRIIVGEIALDVLLVSLLFIGAFIAFGYLAHEVVREDDNVFDQKVFSFFQAYATAGFIAVMKVLTFFGNYYFIMPAYIFLITFLFIKGRRTDAINIIIIAVTSTLLMFGLKEFYHRERPELPLFRAATNYSFPSGHALSSFIFCSVITYLIWRTGIVKKWKWIISLFLLVFAISIGISRIVLRYHYASDVLAGFYLGVVWAFLALWLERKLTPRIVEQKLDSP